MNDRSRLLWLASVCTALGAWSACSAPAEEESGTAPPSGPRPNILMFYADDHAQAALSAYGSGLNHTPNIDRLADEGARFASSFVGNSICAPARATILTGKHSHANGVLDNGHTFDPAQDTFPKRLQAAGYQTALFGKWHLKSNPTGFDDWQVLIGQGPYYNPPMRTAAGDTKVEGYTTEIITDLALEWLTSGRRGDAPFLLMVQHKAPHRRWYSGPDELRLFEGVDLLEPPTLFDDYAGRASGAATQEMTIARHLDDIDLKFTQPTGMTAAQLDAWNEVYVPRNDAFFAAQLEGEDLVRWKYQRYIKDYLRCIQAVDVGVGRILDHLDETGLADETVVIYTSDQGFYLGEHGWYDKRWMYEESLRTPMVVRWPQRVQAGTVVDALVQNVDVAPTLLALAGVAAPADMHGRSFVPLLEGSTPPDWRRSIYYRYYEFPGVHAVQQHRGVRTERYKLIQYYQLDEWELFDLARDPHELESVYGDPAYDDVQAELTAELERLATEVGEPPLGSG